MTKEDALPAALQKYLHEHDKELQEISVAGRLIGDRQPAFIIAEAACNHMCDMELAVEMIDQAAAAGADAIKFQTYKAEKLVTGDAVAFWGEEKVTQLEYYKRLDRFGRKEYEALFAHAESKGIVPFSSPFDAESTEMLAELGMPVFKIASCDIPDLRHIRHVASFGRPIMLSTGASSESEIDQAIASVFQQGNFQLMLLACTLSYPTQFEDANLARIRSLKKRYPGMIVGVSDHTEPDPNMVIPSVAVAMGASIIEKHYTLDRSMTGSGHFFAVDPGSLKMMVDNIRITQEVQGSGELGVADSETKAWHSARRSVVAEVLISKGTVITSEMLGVKRPGGGLPASEIDKIVGKKTTRDIAENSFINFEDIE